MTMAMSMERQWLWLWLWLWCSLIEESHIVFTTLGSAGHPCMEGANTCTPVVFCRRHLITYFYCWNTKFTREVTLPNPTYHATSSFPPSSLYLPLHHNITSPPLDLYYPSTPVPLFLLQAQRSWCVWWMRQPSAASQPPSSPYAGGGQTTPFVI